MADDTAVEREIRVPVEPERAWELVTEPEHLERWFAEQVELDPTPGAPVRVIGVCGSGSFSLSAAAVDPRIRALATVSIDRKSVV